MDRLISADALDREMYRKSFEVDDGRNVWNSGLWIRYKIFEEAIRDAPTIDAEPVRHGTWRNYKDEHTCSVCGEVVTGDWVYEDSAYDYCPWCGARMDAERKEE